MEIKVLNPQDRMTYYVVAVEFVAKDATKNINDHIVLSLMCENFQAGGATIVLFPTGRTSNYYNFYYNGLMRANQKAKEENPSAPGFTKIDDEQLLLATFPAGRFGDPLTYKNGGTITVQLDAPMWQVWRADTQRVTVGYDANLRPIQKDVKAGEYVMDPRTGQKKVVTSVSMFLIYNSAEGESVSDITNYADVYNYATRTLRPMAVPSAPIADTGNQSQPSDTSAQAPANNDNPFA